MAETAATPRRRRPTKAVAAAAPKTPAPSKDSKVARAAAVAARVNRSKRFGPGTIVTANQVVIPKRFTTGSLSFDVAMAGGFPANQWTEIVGNENVGKTTMVHKALAANQALDPDFVCVWISSEGYDSDLADKCGVDRTRVHLIETNLMEDAYDQALEYLEERACSMVVIDSYPAMTTEVEDKTDMDENAQMAAGAKLTNKFMRKCIRAGKRDVTNADDDPFFGVFINQWRDKVGVMYGETRITPGGKGKNFWMYVRLDISREFLYEGSGNSKAKVGQTIKINVMKMKGARGGLLAATNFYFAESNLGFHPGDYDLLTAVFNLATAFDVITRSSGTRGSFVLPDTTTRKSEDAVLQALREEPALRTMVEKEVFDAVQRGKVSEVMDAPEIAEDDDDDAPPAPRRHPNRPPPKDQKVDEEPPAPSRRRRNRDEDDHLNMSGISLDDD